jgi:hypothetical protein
MPRVAISIDGETLMDADVGQWTKEPPHGVNDLVTRATSSPQPWYPAILAALQNAILTDKHTTITVATRSDGWTLEVAQ